MMLLKNFQPTARNAAGDWRFKKIQIIELDTYVKDIVFD